MSSYPWSVLGLDGPATEKEIRSAYARRLKVVRPDTDPKAFQKLVEARAFAFELARERAEEEQFDSIEEEEETAPPSPASARPGETVDEHDTDRSQAIVRTADGEPVIAPPERIIAAPVTISLDVTTPLAPSRSHTPPPPPPVTGEASKWGAMRDDGGLPPHLAAEQGPILQSPDAVLVRLRALLANNRRAPPADVAALVLADLGRLSRPVRVMLEPDLLSAMAAALTLPEPEKRSWLAEIEQRLRRTPSTRLPTVAAARRALFVALDEEFGWTTSDRSVYRHLTAQQAQRVMSELHTGLSEARIAREGLPPRWDGDGLPILDANDMRFFFGTELAHYGAHYEEVRAARKWPAHWRLSLLLLAPLWALGLKNWRYLSFWLTAFFGMGQGLVAMEHFVVPALQASSENTRGALTTLGNLLAFAPLFAMHFYAAGYSHRIELNRLARLASSADRKGVIDPEERARFFRRRAAAFRFKDEGAKSGGWFRNWTPSTWFWVFVVYVAIKLLALVGGK